MDVWIKPIVHLTNNLCIGLAVIVAHLKYFNTTFGKFRLINNIIINDIIVNNSNLDFQKIDWSIGILCPAIQYT